ncbi:STAS domain-containing protein [Pseudodesulfovibrio tunisiensis]|uniref:STAS domain-containing protein n=1 Tax=Pseudodesulfovibrio tunisiensis TaxID=463192 RepID=UPI001FB39FA9|nr:STAS domain-containing protein [Pseudodesulfovibrio tunisiensis]
MQLTSETRNGFLVVSVSGRMDAVTAPEFERECSALSTPGTRLVADLSGLEYISSAGLRSILATAKRLKANKGDIRFCGLQGMVLEVFEVSGFAAMFSIHPNQEAAVAV